MFKAYFKKNYEKLISTFVTILVTLSTNELVNSSEILKDIVNDEISLWRILVWIAQVVIIMLFSVLVEFLIKRVKINIIRHNVRFKKSFPLKNCTKLDKQKEIDNIIQLLNDYTEKIKNESKMETDERLYLYKCFLSHLYSLTSVISNIIYYKNQCITSSNEQPIASKFSVVEMSFYCAEIKHKYEKF